MIVREKRKRLIAIVMTLTFLLCFVVNSYASEVTSSYSIDKTLSPCWRQCLSGIVFNVGFPTSYAANAPAMSVYDAEDMHALISSCPYYNGNNSCNIENLFILSSTLGGGAISWSTYKTQISSGRVVNFICSSTYNGIKNHATLGFSYQEEVSGAVTMIKYYDPYDETVKQVGYDYYKQHYWYETNYDIRKVAV